MLIEQAINALLLKNLNWAQQDCYFEETTLKEHSENRANLVNQITIGLLYQGCYCIEGYWRPERF